VSWGRPASTSRRGGPSFTGRNEGERDARIVRGLLAVIGAAVAACLIARPLCIHSGMFRVRLAGTGRNCAVQWLRLARGVPGLRMHQVAADIVLVVAFLAAGLVIAAAAVLNRPRPAARHARTARRAVWREDLTARRAAVREVYPLTLELELAPAEDAA